MTADGIPVIWHDDSVLIFSRESGLPQLRGICDLTLEEFKQLSPAHRSNSSTTAQESCEERDSCSDRVNSHAGASTSAAELPCTGLGRVFNSEQGKRMGHAMRWAVSEDDELPTLAEVFQVGRSNPLHLYTTGYWKFIQVSRSFTAACMIEITN